MDNLYSQSTYVFCNLLSIDLRCAVTYIEELGWISCNVESLSSYEPLWSQRELWSYSDWYLRVPARSPPNGALTSKAAASAIWLRSHPDGTLESSSYLCCRTAKLSRWHPRIKQLPLLSDCEAIHMASQDPAAISAIWWWASKEWCSIRTPTSTGPWAVASCWISRLRRSHSCSNLAPISPSTSITSLPLRTAPILGASGISTVSLSPRLSTLLAIQVIFSRV